MAKCLHLNTLISWVRPLRKQMDRCEAAAFSHSRPIRPRPTRFLRFPSGEFFVFLLLSLMMGGFGLGCSSSETANSTTPTAVSTTACYSSLTLASNASPQLAIQNQGVYKANSIQAHTQNIQRLVGHVPRIVQKSMVINPVDEMQNISMSIVLQPNHKDELQQLLSDLYNPSSPQYHRFLTTSEFQSRFAPSDDEISQTLNLLSANGFQVNSVDENHLLIHATASAQSVSAFFNTELNNFEDLNGNRFFAPAYELQIPRGTPIQAVMGLENAIHARHHHIQLNPLAQGTGPNRGLSPKDIVTAYHVPTLTSGPIQTVALFELDGYTASDITAYENYFSLAHSTLTNTLVGGFSGTPGSGAAEVTLDIELIEAISPGSPILVYEGPNSTQGVLNTYSRIASDNLATVVSTSWGLSEDFLSSAFLQAENTIFQQFATQGQTFYAASGDSGAYDNGSSISVDDPASQPYTIGVGGTTLTISSDGSYGSETTWNTVSSGAGGGGISKVWTIPSWQKGVISTTAKTSRVMRNVPDVALNSDPNTGYAIYFKGSWQVFGGTSAAAPLWGAFTALVNQKRIGNGSSAIGFLNPTIYAMNVTSNCTNATFLADFHDILDGTTNQFYPAVTGYDAATGWGSFRATELLTDLANQ